MSRLGRTKPAHHGPHPSGSWTLRTLVARRARRPWAAPTSPAAKLRAPTPAWEPLPWALWTPAAGTGRLGSTGVDSTVNAGARAMAEGTHGARPALYQGYGHAKSELGRRDCRCDVAAHRAREVISPKGDLATSSWNSGAGGRSDFRPALTGTSDF